MNEVEPSQTLLNITSSLDDIIESGLENYTDNVLSSSPELSPAIDSFEDFEREHVGHEAQHGTMALILLCSLFGFQFLILFWKQKHYRSFQAATLFGLWLIPILVYNWFSIVYKVSYAVGMFGYIIIMLTFFRILEIFYEGAEIFELGIILLGYGLYFGVLSRDFVEICTDRMASTLGYYSKDGFPRKHLRANICAICGVAATGIGEKGEQPPANQKIFKLSCRHVFHDDCIRGCKEKVDLKEFKTNPWDTQQQLYLSLLDGVRYLIVWQPVIFAIVHLTYHIFGLE
ncbi:1234_t:CDS:2 [Entrophospora sp. SA101]|nr:1234_t:CDS:2 [Entrophospora sp. SA101]